VLLLKPGNLSVRSYLRLRVVPASLGAHAATAGSFTLMEFAEFKPVDYLKSETSSLFLKQPEETRAYQRILGRWRRPRCARENRGS